MEQVESSAAFRAWLGKRNMAARSISDTCSRLKRLSGFVDLSAIKSEAELRARLIQSPQFAKLTPSVRSQVKKSGALFIEFRAGQAR
jgi:hypothetical protein